MRLHLVVPGDIHTLTGGYIYDKRMADGLRLKGHQVQIHSLEDPFSSEESSRQCWDALRSVPKGEAIIFDSLVFGANPGLLKEIKQNHIIVALIHLPLSYSKSYLNTRLEKLSVSEEEAFSYADRILVTSKFTMDLLVGVGIDPQKIRIVLPGVDVFTRKSGCPKLPRNFITVSNFTKNKGHVLLIEAMKEIRQLDWTLDCYGDKNFDPEHVSRLSQLIEKYRLTDRIFLHGPVNGKTLSQVYVNSDLLIHPSEFETYGMVLTEALAHGIPVVASKGGAITQTVPESMGIFFEVNDSKSLQQILGKLLLDTGNYQALCLEASSYFQRAQSWEKSVEEFEKAIR